MVGTSSPCLSLVWNLWFTMGKLSLRNVEWLKDTFLNKSGKHIRNVKYCAGQLFFLVTAVITFAIILMMEINHDQP